MYNKFKTKKSSRNPYLKVVLAAFAFVNCQSREKNRLAEENHKLTEKVADLKRHLKTSNESYDKQIKELDANVNLFIENHHQLIDNNQ